MPWKHNYESFTHNGWFLLLIQLHQVKMDLAELAAKTGVKPCSTRPLYFDMDGFRLSSAFNIDRYRSALKYTPRRDDIFIATYPKCGTTWLQVE